MSVNGKNFYANLNVTTNGITVYSSLWPLFGQTEIALTPAEGMPVGPVINAGEVLQILPLGGRTLTRDGKESEHYSLLQWNVVSCRRLLLTILFLVFASGGDDGLGEKLQQTTFGLEWRSLLA